MESRGETRFAALDGARGVAALLVLTSHAANLKLLPAFLGYGAGKMGVALFFVLSGFLMAYLYAHRSFDAGELSRYARNRIGRVAPLYYLIVLISLAVPPGLFWTFSVPGHAAEHLLLVRGQETLWTIPVEMQFYVAFLTIWYATAAGRPVLAFAALAVAAVALILVFRRAGPETDFLPFWIPTFLFGAGVGIAWRRHGARFQDLKPEWLGWLAPLAFIAALPGIRRAMGFPMLAEWIDPITIGIPSLFFLAALLRAGPMRLLEHRALRWLGGVSYGIYLFHYPILMNLVTWLRPSGAAGHLLVFAITIVLTLTVSWLSFRFFETPAKNAIIGVRRAEASAAQTR